MADGKVVIETGLDSTGLKKELNNLKPQFTEMGNTGTKAMNQISNSMNGATKSIGSLKSSLKGIISTLGVVFSLKALIN